MSELLLTVLMMALGHASASLAQNQLHRWLGHTVIGGALRRIHVGSHHALYPSSHMVARRYEESEASLTALYLLPAGALASLFFWLLPVALAAGVTLGLGASFAAHVYLHEHYHLSGSWLRRYAWFRRRRLLHAIHHRDGTKNFGLIDFFWDRLFGTFRAGNAKAP